MAGRRQQHEESIYNWGSLAPAALPTSSSGAPRVKTYNVPAPAAAPPRRMHEDSSQIESILKPVRGIRDAQRRAGITPTNHSRHNVQAVKEQSRLNALQKLQQQEDRTVGAAARSRSSPGTFQKCLSTGSAIKAAADRPTLGRSISAGSRDAADRMYGSSSGGGLSRNFVEENKAAAAAAAAAKRPVKAESKQDPGGYMQKSEYGQVPAYLIERKMQLAQEHEALMAAKAAAAIPPGLRQMPEPERLDTLKLLDQNRVEVEAKLSALPIVIETPSMKRHKEELERRLAEIEEAWRIFSRPNVLVHADTAGRR